MGKPFGRLRFVLTNQSLTEFIIYCPMSPLCLFLQIHLATKTLYFFGKIIYIDIFIKKISRLYYLIYILFQNPYSQQCAYKYV